MSNRSSSGKLILFLSLILILSNQIYAQQSSTPDPASNTIIVPGPNPFSLDAGSAVYCINLLKNNRFLKKVDDSVELRIIEVNTVWSWFLEYDESFPEGYRKRYDIIVNGSPLDWDNSYIEYGGDMLNLRLLFLYRNQHPPTSLKAYTAD